MNAGIARVRHRLRWLKIDFCLLHIEYFIEKIWPRMLVMLESERRKQGAEETADVY